MEFSTTLSVRAEQAHLTVSGDLDAFTALRLRRPAHEALDLGCRHFTVDLTDLTFIDAAGLGALVRLCNVAPRVGGSFRLVNAGPVFLRTCDLAGLSAAFRISVLPTPVHGRGLTGTP